MIIAKFLILKLNQRWFNIVLKLFKNHRKMIRKFFHLINSLADKVSFKEAIYLFSLIVIRIRLAHLFVIIKFLLFYYYLLNL